MFGKSIEKLNKNKRVEVSMSKEKKDQFVGLKLSESQIQELNRLVSQGFAKNRSQVIQNWINMSIIGLK